MAKPNPMGSTFAERAAAARGVAEFEAAEAAMSAPVPNSTFASRAGRASAEAETPATPDGQEEPDNDLPAGDTTDDVNDADDDSETAAKADDEKTVEADDSENKAVQDGDNKSGRGVFRRS